MAGEEVELDMDFFNEIFKRGLITEELMDEYHRITPYELVNPDDYIDEIRAIEDKK